MFNKSTKNIFFCSDHFDIFFVVCIYFYVPKLCQDFGTQFSQKGGAGGSLDSNLLPSALDRTWKSNYFNKNSYLLWYIFPASKRLHLKRKINYLEKLHQINISGINVMTMSFWITNTEFENYYNQFLIVKITIMKQINVFTINFVSLKKCQIYRGYFF